MPKCNRVITLQIEVEAPADVGEAEISAAINAALDEPMCDWGNWTVGAAHIVNVTKYKVEEEG